MVFHYFNTVEPTIQKKKLLLNLAPPKIIKRNVDASGTLSNNLATTIRGLFGNNQTNEIHPPPPKIYYAKKVPDDTESDLSDFEDINLENTTAGIYKPQKEVRLDKELQFVTIHIGKLKNHIFHTLRNNFGQDGYQHWNSVYTDVNILIDYLNAVKFSSTVLLSTVSHILLIITDTTHVDKHYVTALPSFEKFEKYLLADSINIAKLILENGGTSTTFFRRITSAASSDKPFIGNR